MKTRKHLSAEQKVIILRELLENKVPISQLAEKHGIHVNDIYAWKKKLFDNATDIFSSQPNKSGKSDPGTAKIEKLEDKLKKRDEAISFLLRENIEIKKSIGGDF